MFFFCYTLKEQKAYLKIKENRSLGGELTAPKGLI